MEKIEKYSVGGMSIGFKRNGYSIMDGLKVVCVSVPIGILLGYLAAQYL